LLFYPLFSSSIKINNDNNIYNNQNQGSNPFYRQKSIYDTFRNENNNQPHPNTIYDALNNNNNNNNFNQNNGPNNNFDFPSENDVNKNSGPYPNM